MDVLVLEGQVLQVWWWVMVRGWGHVAELGVVWVHGDCRVCLHPGRLMQFGNVGGGEPSPPGAEQRSKQREGAGQGSAAVAGGAVSAGRGSLPHISTANDGALQGEGRQIKRRRHVL